MVPGRKRTKIESYHQSRRPESEDPTRKTKHLILSS